MHAVHTELSDIKIVLTEQTAEVKFGAKCQLFQGQLHLGLLL